MALGSNQTLIEMSIRNFPMGTGRPAHMAENFAAICEYIFLQMLESRRLTTLWTSTDLYKNGFTLFTLMSDLLGFDSIELTHKISDHEKNGGEMYEWRRNVSRRTLNYR
jgi:hypothetical protein